MKPRVFIPEPIAKIGLDLLRTECECIADWEGKEESPVDARVLQDSDAVIVRLFNITADDIRQAVRLRVIAKHGVGVDNIDCRAATDRRIPVIFTPAANVNAVAEHTLALMLALSREIIPANASLLQGNFERRSMFRGIELAGKTLGLIGLGRIGSRVAEMTALGFGMRVYAYDPFVTHYAGPAVIVQSIEEILPIVDFVSIHVTLSQETRHLVNTKFLALLKPGCRLINTSRGAVVDESALVSALKEKRLAGAALDVFEIEPLPAAHPLCKAPNALLTPHISSSTRESLDRMSLQVAQGVLDVLHGRKPDNILNPEVLR